MTNLSHQIIPRGVFFEADKNRWRVRIYRNNRVIHRKYHKTLEAALQDWKAAYNSVPELIVRTTNRTFAPRSTTFEDLLEALCLAA